MLKTFVAVGMCSFNVLGLLTLNSGGAFGQEFPTKPIRIMTSEVGGTNDLVTRIIAQGISGPLGQPVLVDNRGSSVVGPLGAKAAPDGYTLVTSSPGFWLGPLQQKASYDPIKDFAPITNITKAPGVLIVHPSLPVKSVKELIALAKARPGELNYASGNFGSFGHLGAELFNSIANVKIVRINYKGGGPEKNSILAGETQMIVTPAGSIMSYIKSGQLRALAVTSPEPSGLFPGLPTVAASLPGYQIENMGGMWAPAGTPAPIIRRLNQEVARVLNQPDVKEKLANNGVEAGGSSPEVFDAMVKADTARMGKVIKDAGIRLD